MSYPSDLLYTEDHEWVKIDGNIATVGITHYAATELGDVVYVEIETEGETLENHGVFGTIEAVKTVSDLFMPVAGEVKEVNEDLNDDPEVVNKDPYGAGWMIRIEMTDPEDTGHLLSAEAYMAQIGAEA